ncbi:MAG: TlpA family protein disulfide reductase [Acidobacteriota bacterium]|nr:TlpA family protein disulfide reductase [Acidobacteriota bacterium]
MPALEPGTKAPPVKLPTVSGGTFDLGEALKRGPVALAFFKSSCPVCQLAFPYLERLYRSNLHAANPGDAANPGSALQLIGVSQDEKRDTESFMKELGITFPMVLEETSKYAVSNAYGLTNVPTIFVIAPDGGFGTIETSSVGWYKQDIEALNQKMAQAAGKPPQPVFKPGEDVPEFKAG